MGHTFSKYKVVIIVALSLVAALAFLLSSLSDDPSSSLLTGQEAGTEVAGERGIVETLLQLRSVSLTGTVFSDPAFIYLRDYGTQIISEPIGRPNPFAPFSLRSTATTTTTSGATSTPNPALPARP